MSPMAYYSPAILGALVAIVYAVFGRGDYSQTDRALLAAIGVPSAAIIGQLLMLVAQGIFAGVLPVPFGRTIRGRWCVAIGLLLLAGMVLGGIAFLASRAGSRSLFLPLAGSAAGCTVIALMMYGWAWPTARPDFGKGDGD